MAVSCRLRMLFLVLWLIDTDSTKMVADSELACNVTQMAMLPYAVVEFLASRTVGVIVTSWFTSEEEDRCHWPEVPLNATKLAENAAPVNKNWKQFAVRCLGKAADFERAQQKLRMAEDTDDLRTQTDEPGEQAPRKRKRKKSRKMRSPSPSDSSEENDSTSIVHLETPPDFPEIFKTPTSRLSAQRRSSQVDLAPQTSTSSSATNVGGGSFGTPTSRLSAQRGSSQVDLAPQPSTSSSNSATDVGGVSFETPTSRLSAKRRSSQVDLAPQPSTASSNSATDVGVSLGTPTSRLSAQRESSPVDLAPQPSTSSSATNVDGGSFGTPTSRLSAPRGSSQVDLAAQPSTASSATNVGTPRSTTPFSRVLYLLEDIRETQRIQGGMLRLLTSRVGEVDNLELPEEVNFPLRNLDEFDSLEVILRDEGTLRKVTQFLADIGGRTLEESVKRVMSHIMTTEVAKKLNFSQSSGLKRPFKGTALWEATYKAIKRNPLFSSSCNRQQVGQAVGKWLTGARDRDGGRAQRVRRAQNVQTM